MKITRDGKTYELTINELNLAYEEMRRITWRQCMDDAIERAESDGNLRYGVLMTHDEFLDECVEDLATKYEVEDWDERCDEIIYDNAQISGIWVDESWEEDVDDF